MADLEKCQWAIELLKPISSPSQKRGMLKIRWFRWEPMMYESFVSKMSPGWMFSLP